MNQQSSQKFRKPLMIIALTLAIGAMFKIAAFGREAFITSRFGLTSVTDTYFALQQFPVTFAAYMFGAFARAFTPAYAQECATRGRAPWFAGLLTYATAIAVILTGLSFLFAHQILLAFTRSGNWATLAVLSICYVPIVFIGMRGATWTSQGRNFASMTLNGSPYLVMTVALIVMYFIGRMDNLSLAVSMTIGFTGVGVLSIAELLFTERPFKRLADTLRPWKFDGFRKFTKQLTASSVETAGYSVNQFFLLYFMARVGAGAISANNCATRIGMLGFSLLAIPLLQLMQARLCKSEEHENTQLAKRYVIGTAIGASLFALTLFLARRQVVAAVYLRGNFSATAFEEVVAILPAWLCYFVVLCMNTIISQPMFHAHIGQKYTRNMLVGYLCTNILRFALGTGMGASWIIWCAVIAEGAAFFANVITLATREHAREEPAAAPIGAVYSQEA